MTADDAAEIAARRLDGGAKWLLQLDGDIAGTGGILYHYNRPYGDVFMEIAEPFAAGAWGAFLVQELKGICYEGGSVPAARCNVNNAASRSTLQKAGFSPCGNIVTGDGRGGLAVRIENSADKKWKVVNRNAPATAGRRPGKRGRIECRSLRPPAPLAELLFHQCPGEDHLSEGVLQVLDHAARAARRGGG